MISSHHEKLLKHDNCCVNTKSTNIKCKCVHNLMKVIKNETSVIYFKHFFIGSFFLKFNEKYPVITSKYCIFSK